MQSAAPPLMQRWPFWLLLAAWICANSPQAATYAVLSWLAEARSFTHQQRLTSDVAHLLVGEASPVRTAAPLEASAARDTRLPESAVPESAVLKKIDLGAEATAEKRAPALVAPGYGVGEVVVSERLRASPPHRPPRGSLAS